MRECVGLYRGKWIDNGEWVEGYYVTHQKSGFSSVYCHFIVRYEADVSFWHEVYPGTIGECIGLKDKNGKLIFEGDIIAVERGWNEKVIYTVEYDAEICSFIGDSVNYIGFTTFENDGDRIEIIGNIHDNPELLKGGEQ